MTGTPSHSTSRSLVPRNIALPGPLDGHPQEPSTDPSLSPSALVPGAHLHMGLLASGDQGPHPHPARPSPNGRAKGMAWGPAGLRSWQDSVKPPPGVVRREHGQEGHSCVLLVNCVRMLSGHRPWGTQTRPLVTGSSHSAVSECAGLSSIQRAGPLPAAPAPPPPPPAGQPGRRGHPLLAHTLRFWPLEKRVLCITYFWSHPCLAALRPQ